jgi:hypothetical protein
MARPMEEAPLSATRPRVPIEVRIAIAALGFRLVGAVVGFLANITVPDYQDQGFTVLQSPNPFWDRFARYDSGWYHDIAANGYAFVEGGRSNLAFFPLYPTLMGAGGRLLGGAQEDFYFAGIVISWLAFVLAMPLLYRLASLDLPRDSAIRATTFAAVFPSAYFFGVVYSESLFLLTLVGAVLALRTQRWGWAIVAGAAMTATRVNGVMFVPALAWIAWQSAPSTVKDRAWAAIAVAGSAIGIGAYSIYNYRLSGNFFEWYDAIVRWGYHPGGNPVGGLYAIGVALVNRPMQFLSTERMAPYDTLNAVVATFALCLVPMVWKRFGFGYALVIVLGLALPLSSGQYEGLGRYCAVLFPIPIWLGSLRGEARLTWLVACFVLFYTLGLVLFGNVHPLF